MRVKHVKDAIRDIPDFPKPGIMFKDITPVLRDPELFASSVDAFVQRYRGKGIRHVLAIESRGFMFGAPVAYAIEAGFIPMRKAGKLPHKSVGEEFELEYGTDRIEMHEDSFEPGEKVLIIDDLLATGGTAGAAVRLARHLEAEIHEVAFLVELTALNGRKNLGDAPIFSLIEF